jgi:squalene-associated FAD-dependent desaturase
MASYKLQDSNSQHTDVLVIGGGFAGISAAYHSVKAGKSVRLLEATQFLGGRARSFTDETTGEIIDNGQHLLMGCYTDTLSMLEDFGTKNFLSAQPRMRVDFIKQDGNRYRFDTGRLPGKVGTVLGLLLLEGLSIKEKWRIIRFASSMELGLMKPQEGESTSSFLYRGKQTQRIIEQFWEPIILATLNASLENASAELLYTVLQLAFFADEESTRLYFPSHGLSELLENVPQWFAKHHSECLLNQRAVKIEHGTNVSTWNVITRDKAFTANNVILAVAPRALQALARQNSALENLFEIPDFSFSPIVSLYFWFDREILPDTSFHAMISSTTQWIFNRRRLCSAPFEVTKKYPGHIALTVSAADSIVQQTADEIIHHCLQEIQTAFPDIKQAQLLHARVIKEKTATILATPSILTHRPPARTLHPSCFLAGDWTQTHLPATIEGAVRSGKTAAELLH